jgi:sugar phosphate isomerase/epimerase
LIDRAVAADVPVVQICVKPDLAAMPSDALESLRQYAVDRNKTLEIGTVGSDPDNLLKFLRIAEALDATLVRTIFTNASPDASEERAQIAKIAEQYAEQQVYLAIENHEASSYLDLAALCQDIDNEYVGICLDTVNSLGRGEGVREVTEALMPFTKCLHVKDFTVLRHKSDMELTITGASAGEGKLDIPAQLELLNRYRPGTSVILEQWTPLQADLEATVQLQERWAEAGIRYLKLCVAEFDTTLGS